MNWDSELENVKEMGRQGKSMREIGEHYGVSRQRIKQICLRHIPDWHISYGKAVRDLAKEKEAEALNQAYLEKWGPNRNLIAKDLYSSQRFKFSRKKVNALKIGYSWEIVFTDLDWPTHCPILGLELDYFAPYAQENSPSFDRIDSEQGYVKGNVQIISWRANRIKNNGTAEEHRKIADYLDSIQ